MGERNVAGCAGRGWSATKGKKESSQSPKRLWRYQGRRYLTRSGLRDWQPAGERPGVIGRGRLRELCEEDLGTLPARCCVFHGALESVLQFLDFFFSL